MTSITYFSSTTRPFTSRELVALLAQCREQNARIGITGMLLYKDGEFMQVLEGTPSIVRRKFLSIRLDDRHENVTVIRDEAVDSRQFSDWSMAFWNLNSIDPASIPGYSYYMNTALTAPMFQSDPTRALELLLGFRNCL